MWMSLHGVVKLKSDGCLNQFDKIFGIKTKLKEVGKKLWIHSCVCYRPLLWSTIVHLEDEPL